ncbi:MAG: hypothetical protein ACTSW1_15800 [Candidatus Hodarchaeales archaeon]
MVIENHNVSDFPFIDEIFFNSPLCQICEYAAYGMGGVCSLILNRRLPKNLVIKDSQIISCSAQKSWVQGLELSDFDAFDELLGLRELKDSD